MTQNGHDKFRPAVPDSLSTADHEGSEKICVERHYSVLELAELWHLSQKTIRRMFEHEAGVIVWGEDETKLKRRYRTLRIPETVVIRVHQQMRATE